MSEPLPTLRDVWRWAVWRWAVWRWAAWHWADNRPVGPLVDRRIAGPAPLSGECEPCRCLQCAVMPHADPVLGGLSRLQPRGQRVRTSQRLDAKLHGLLVAGACPVCVADNRPELQSFIIGCGHTNPPGCIWVAAGDLGESSSRSRQAAELRSYWSGRRDLNSRPPVPQTGALTKLRHVPNTGPKARTAVRISRLPAPSAQVEPTPAGPTCRRQPACS
jgi:hypothetical protein